MTDQQQYFSEKSLARMWGMSYRTLQKWRWAGLGPPYIKIGCRVRYSLINIKNFEEKNLRQGGKRFFLRQSFTNLNNTSYEPQ